MLILVLGMLALGSAQAPQPPTDRPPPARNTSQLTIVAVEVQPANPGPDTLCKLRVRLRNAGTVAASDLSFQVTVNGKRLGNFINHTFMSTLDVGKETDVPLFNFWSSEYSRPYPSDGRLVIEVGLIGARWVAPGSTNAATLAGPVQPLPSPFSVTLTTARQKVAADASAAVTNGRQIGRVYFFTPSGAPPQAHSRSMNS